MEQLLSSELITEIQKRDRALSAINAIAVATAHTTDLRNAMSRILDSVVRLMDADAGGFSLVDERLKLLEMVCQDMPLAPDVRGFHRKLCAHLTSNVALCSTLFTAEDIDAINLGKAFSHRLAGFESLQCIPIWSKGRLLGLISTFYRNRQCLVSLDKELVVSLVNQIGVAIDNAVLYRGLTERIKETEVLYEVGRTLISTLDHDQVLHQVLKVVQESFGYSRCGILLIDEDRGELYVKAAYGHGPQVLQSLRLRVGQEGITGWVAGSGEAMNIPDIRKEPRYVPGPYPAASELALPLKIGSQVIGVLDVQSNRIGAFGERDLRILSSFADQAAIAIENARLYDRTREMGVTAERNRLARELHDVLAQDLTATIVQLEAADNLLVKGQIQKAQEVLRKAMEQARVSLQEARRSIIGLRATLLESLSLSEAIAGETKSFSQVTGISVSFDYSGDDGGLSPDVAIALYRILKEGLNNVRHHAEAHRVEVQLDVGSERCSLTIQDDGKGFDPSQSERLDSAGKHYGLIGMRERAKLLGGSMSIESEISTGTRVRVTIPRRMMPFATSPGSLPRGPVTKGSHKRTGGQH